MVTVYWPVAAVLPTCKLRIELPVEGFGENVAVTPLGSPVAARFTLPLKPYCGVT